MLWEPLRRGGRLHHLADNPARGREGGDIRKGEGVAHSSRGCWQTEFHKRESRKLIGKNSIAVGRANLLGRRKGLRRRGNALVGSKGKVSTVNAPHILPIVSKRSTGPASPAERRIPGTVSPNIYDPRPFISIVLKGSNRGKPGQTRILLWGREKSLQGRSDQGTLEGSQRCRSSVA